MPLAQSFFQSSRLIFNYVFFLCLPLNVSLNSGSSPSPLQSTPLPLPSSVLPSQWKLSPTQFCKVSLRSFPSVTIMSSRFTFSHLQRCSSIQTNSISQESWKKWLFNQSPCLPSWLEPTHFLHCPGVLSLKHISNSIILLLKIFYWSPKFLVQCLNSFTYIQKSLLNRP